MNNSTLTFNMSVSDRKNINSVLDPYQIMPSTQNFLFDKSINTYLDGSNDGIILHMNYITHVFSSNSIENDSTVRQSLRQYVKLAQKLGTKNILIHGPYTNNEWQNLSFGMKVIYDEIIDKGMVLHLEIPSWSSDFIHKMNPNLNEDPKVYLIEYFGEIFKYLSAFPKGSYYIVPDTAHMFANGCATFDDFAFILNKIKSNIKYIHLNGNVNYMFKSDKHCPMFMEDNKIKCWKELSKFCADMGVICIAEVTKVGSTWDEWTKYANEFGFNLVEFNEKYSI